MTQEERELLLKDLCARLPYGVKIYAPTEFIDCEEIKGVCVFTETVEVDCNTNIDVCKVKPYLRPLSSMTEEEEADLEAYSKQELDKYADNVLKHADKDTTRYSKIILIYKDIDWYNKNHFDYRGLIPKDLALEASEGMYKN